MATQREPDTAVARAHDRHALDIAEVLGLRPFQAHAHLGLGTLYASAGQRESARTALTTATELYRAMDMRFWCPRAETALATLA